jgi:hypothetical protein
MAGQPLKVWFHGPVTLLPQPTRVTVQSLDWYVDDIKKALILEAPGLQCFGAPSLIVKHAVPAGLSDRYEATGDELPSNIQLSDGGAFSMNAHFLSRSHREHQLWEVSTGNVYWFQPGVPALGGRFHRNGRC